MKGFELYIKREKLNFGHERRVSRPLCTARTPCVQQRKQAFSIAWQIRNPLIPSTVHRSYSPLPKHPISVAAAGESLVFRKSRISLRELSRIESWSPEARADPPAGNLVIALHRVTTLSVHPRVHDCRWRLEMSFTVYRLPRSNGANERFASSLRLSDSSFSSRCRGSPLTHYFLAASIPLFHGEQLGEINYSPPALTRVHVARSAWFPSRLPLSRRSYISLFLYFYLALGGNRISARDAG